MAAARRSPDTGDDHRNAAGGDDREEPSSTVEGDAENGAQIFASAGCGGCHTLEAAGSSGSGRAQTRRVAARLALTINRVTNGQGAMPAFSDSLSEQEIADVAAYVVESTS